ncbi:glycerophosphodiester phosphodiesterase family protein [Algibacter miyuki]|uniref:Glycerophosphodiester phosphodiesterase family protein n=1 Tax=Algibacter miyuki TaxID=1306933 RepID=A0ABV5H087_9FLAO|nr:glycerophosphodiester phosphodiesterase family protein [Algibacter miyuki]MDN3667580.1 glycerophosphodiester phosphodiesterase family protein [Algibacter miyuki]
MKNTKIIIISKILVLFCFFLDFGIQAQTTSVDRILIDFHDNKHVLVASHRAAHQEYPENSIKAIEECIRLGVDIVELDLRQTKDGEIIVMHDSTVDRTTNGNGRVDDLNWNDLQNLNLIFKGKETNEKIPSFEDVLKVTKEKILIDVDFKANSIDAISKTYALIEEYGMESQVLFYLYDYEKIPLLRSMNSKIKIMPRAYNKKDIKRIFKYDGIYITHIDESFYKAPLMEKMILQGSRVWINALGKYDDMEKHKEKSGFDKLLEKKYINVIQTDFPEELLQYLKEKKLHR